MLDRPKWMLADLLALLLLGDVPADINHDVFFGAGKPPEAVQVFAAYSSSPVAGIVGYVKIYDHMACTL